MTMTGETGADGWPSPGGDLGLTGPRSSDSAGPHSTTA